MEGGIWVLIFGWFLVIRGDLVFVSFGFFICVIGKVNSIYFIEISEKINVNTFLFKCLVLSKYFVNSRDFVNVIGI